MHMIRSFIVLLVYLILYLLLQYSMIMKHIDDDIRSRGDDDSSIDDDHNNKMCISDETTIKCVFNKKRLFGGSALAFVAVVDYGRCYCNY